MKITVKGKSEIGFDATGAPTLTVHLTKVRDNVSTYDGSVILRLPTDHPMADECAKARAKEVTVTLEVKEEA